MTSPTKLSELPEGSSAVIESLLSGRSSLTRLRELGLVPGTRVRIVRRAPSRPSRMTSARRHA